MTTSVIALPRPLPADPGGRPGDRPARRVGAAAAAFANALPPPLLVIAAIVLIQAGAATSKSLMTADNAMGLVLLRNLGAALMLMAVVRPSIVGLTGRQWRDVLGLAAALAAFSGVFYLAIPRVPIGLVVTVGFLGPLLLGVLGARRAVDYIWPALALMGVLLLTPIGGTDWLDPVGLALAFAYAGAWIAYILMSARSGRSIAGLQGLSLAMAITTVMLLPFGWNGARDFLAAPQTLPLIGVVALFTVLPFALEYIALKRMRPSVYGVIVATEPAIAALVALALIGERIGTAGWIALIAVSVAAAGSTLRGSRGEDART